MSVTRLKTSKQEKCPRCGSGRLYLVKAEAPHFSRKDCLDCGARGQPIKGPWSLERARSFVMPFGKFKGRTVGDLADDKVGRSYLAWAAENLEGNAGTAAAIAMGMKAPDEGGAA